MDASRIRKAGELIGHILAPEAAEQAKGWARFFSSWKSSAGDQLAAHSRPADVKNGIVIVEADHPGWIQLLQLRQESLLAGIKKAFPELGIRGIAFRLAGEKGGAGSLKAAPSPSGPSRRAAEPEEEPESPEEAAQRAGTIEETLSGVEDAAFKDLLASVADSLGRKKKG
jgi:hypothetical protein